MQSGNRRVYLVHRMAHDRPDVLERMKAGECATVRQAVRAAGILSGSGHGQGRQRWKPATAQLQ